MNEDDDDFHWENTLQHLGYFFAGIGFLAALVAGLCFFGGWE
jgi:hypothetical protein